jgi:CBS domain-containing protein
VETVNTVETAAFLARHRPFDALEAGELEAVAAAAAEQRYAAGTTVLVEDGAPAEHLFVVRDGSMELMHQGEVVDVLMPGESFGHPSLLTGLAPAFTVRAAADSACLLIPREVALEALSNRAGAGYVAATLRRWLVQAGHVVHALPELGTLQVGELIDRPPLFCPGSVTIQKAAQLMTDNGASAILVRDGANLHILTDALLRARVVAGEISAGNPVSRIVQPAVEVGPERLAVDAVVEMLAAGADHLVVVDSERRALGVLSAADLVGLETRSPFALRHAILRAADEEELIRTAAKLQQLFLTLLDAKVSPADVGRILSLQVDTITQRFIDLATTRLGPPPAPWAWLTLGSTARREFTLASDQESAVAYAAGGDEAECDRYFAQLGEAVTQGLARCGVPPDPNEVVASNALWRMSDERWVQVFRDCLDSPDRSHLIRANVAFDFRHSAGGLDVTAPLVAVLRKAKEHTDFVKRLARTATDWKPPLGFRGALVTARNGDAKGLDLKTGGVIPIVNLARFYALTNGITISSTNDRLVAAAEVGALDAETASALREAFEIVLRIRLAHHAERLDAGLAPDNLVDPQTLSQLTRTQLREAFRVIAHAQKRLSVYVPPGL